MSEDYALLRADEAFLSSLPWPQHGLRRPDPSQDARPLQLHDFSELRVLRRENASGMSRRLRRARAVTSFSEEKRHE